MAKLKPLIPLDEAEGKTARIQVSLPSRVDRSLDDYARFYTDSYGNEAPAKARLIMLMTQKLLDDDKDFQKWNRQKGGEDAAGR